MFHRLGSAILPVLLALFFITSNVMGQSGYKSEEELIRAAEKFFNEKNYEKAFPLFSQVVSNRPDNSHYNYCLGVCIMEVAPDKAEAVRFLELATKSPQNPNDSWLYLGKAYHSSYKYDEAISAFQSYKLNAGRSAWNNANGDALIQMCKNGIDVKNDLSLQRHRILEKSETVTMDFFLLYKNIPEAGRFLKLPKEYEDKSTKGTHESAYVFLPSSGNTLVYSNASKTNGKGYDIFRVLKDSKGLWMFPEMLSDIINSSGDEAFPVIVNDGKTLYFSSKGSRSTGGYDIFRSDLDLSTSSWSEPVPMGPPINSPGDDFYYVPSVDNKFAYFSSNRESAAGKCDVYKVSIINETRNFIAISGLFNCKSGLELSEAKVTIMNPDDRSIVAQFRTPSQDGIYNLKLPVPSTFIYQVELAGFNSQEQLVDLSGYASTKLIQEIYLVRTDEAKEKMTITNRIPVEDKVVAGNKSTFNTAITPGVGDRDMALATTNNRNINVAAPQSKSDVNSESEAQKTTPNAEQNSSTKSIETTPSNSSAQTEVTAADNSASSPSKDSPSKSGSKDDRNTSPANSKSTSTTTNTEAVELVTIENLTSSPGSENKPVNENEKSGNGNASAATGSTVKSTLNSDKESGTSDPGSVASIIPTDAAASTNSSVSENSNPAKVAELKSEDFNINSVEGVSQNQKSANTNSTSEELLTASAELAATVENKSSDVNTKTVSKTNSSQTEKNSSESPVPSNSKAAGTNESNTSKNSDGSLNVDSSTKSSSENSNSGIDGTQPKSIKTSQEGSTTLIQGSEKGKVENNTQEAKNASSESKTSNPIVSDNGSVASSNTAPTASDETKKSVEVVKTNSVASSQEENSKSVASSELVTENKTSYGTISEKQNSSPSNSGSTENSASKNELSASTQSTSSEVPAEKNNLDSEKKVSSEEEQLTSKDANTVSKSNSSPEATTTKKSSATSQEDLNKNTSKGIESQPANIQAQSNASSTVSNSNNKSSATDPAVSSKNTSATPEMVKGDNSTGATKQTDEGLSQPSSVSNKTEVNQSATAENDQTGNSSPLVDAEIGNEITNSGKQEKRSGIFGSRSKKKDKEVAPVSDAIPEFATTQPIAEEMPEPPKNLIFRVQLGAYKDRNADDLKKKYSDIGLNDLIYVKNDDGLLLVMTGSEKSYDSALSLKATMIEKGVADAFIVAYSDGTRLPLESVVKIDE